MNDEITLTASGDSVALNRENTVGVMTYQRFHNNENTVTVSPEYLKQWAEAVADAFSHDSAVEIVASDSVPLIAREYDYDSDETPDLGIGVAPKVEQDTSANSEWTGDNE